LLFHSARKGDPKVQDFKGTIELIGLIVAMIVSLLSLIVSVLALIWDVIKDRDKLPPFADKLKKISDSIFNPKIAWTLVVVLSILCTYLLLRKPFTGSNRLVTYLDFEGTEDGWSEFAVQERSGGITVKEFPEDSDFPGSMTSQVTGEYALTGQTSLKVSTSVDRAGTFKSFLYRQGAFTGNGVTIYVMAPDPDTASSLQYIQLCVPSHDWVCSAGTSLVPQEWTPITIDLSTADAEGIALSEQKLTELAVQWVIEAQPKSTHELYFDSAEIYHAGP
jgi:hypothetical protein